MPNWCYCDLHYFGSKDEVRKLRDVFAKARSLKDDEWIKANVGFEHENWLGNLVLVCGAAIQEKDKQIKLKDGKVVEEPSRESDEHIRCRGEISLIDDGQYETSMDFSTSSAWSPTYDLFEKLASVSGCKYYLYAEEPGCGVYVNSDVEGEVFPIHYLLMTTKEEHYCKTWEEVCRLLQVYGYEIPESFEAYSQTEREECDYMLIKYADK